MKNKIFLLLIFLTPLICCFKCEDDRIIAYPNPFTESTTIKYFLDNPYYVTLDIFDSQGKKIINLVNQEQSGGEHEVIFIPDNLPSGVYYYRIQIGKYFKTDELILVN